MIRKAILLGLVGSAIFAQSSHAITLAEANEAAGPRPSCMGGATLNERFVWAQKAVATETYDTKGATTAPRRDVFRLVELCAGEDIIVEGRQMIPAPKGAGVAIPSDIVFRPIVTVLPDHDDSARTEPKRSNARDHGSCSVQAFAPDYSGGAISSAGQINCTNPATPVTLTTEQRRKYNSTGTSVQYNIASWSGNGLIYGNTPWKNCPAVNNSTFNTSADGQRYHYPSWGGSTVFSTYVNACP